MIARKPSWLLIAVAVLILIYMNAPTIVVVLGLLEVEELVLMVVQEL